MHRLRTLLAAVVISIAIPAAPSAAQTTAAQTLDLQGSAVGFTVYAQMLFKLTEEGRFRDFVGDVSYDPAHPADTRVDLTVYTATVDMKKPEHAALLRSGDFFDVDRFPTIQFRSFDANVQPDGSLAVSGDLTIRGVTRRIAIPMKIIPPPRSGAGAARLETTFQIDRTEFGLVGSPKFSGFKVSIAKNVGIHIALATRVQPR